MPDYEELSKSWNKQAAAEVIFMSLAEGSIKGISVTVSRIQVSFGISRSCSGRVKGIWEGFIPVSNEHLRVFKESSLLFICRYRGS